MSNDFFCVWECRSSATTAVWGSLSVKVPSTPGHIIFHHGLSRFSCTIYRILLPDRNVGNKTTIGCTCGQKYNPKVAWLLLSQPACMCGQKCFFRPEIIILTRSIPVLIPVYAADKTSKAIGSGTRTSALWSATYAKRP